MPRTVLVIAYFFPPIAGAGVQRILKFVKYLPDSGYRPIVVTTRARDYPARDTSLISEVPASAGVVRAVDPAWLRLASAAFDRLNLKSLQSLAAWPDPAAAWIPSAVVSALRQARRHRPDVILSSAPPFSAHVVASLVARATGVPWVADFRDEFSTNPHDREGPAVVRHLNTRLEQLVTRHAARVVTVADYFELPGIAAESSRRTTIVNGVDPADIPEPFRARRSDRFRLTFVGTLYGDRDLQPVMACLRRLVRRGKLDPSKCEVRIVGSMWLPARPDAGEIELVVTDYVPHQQAVIEMQDASVLLFYAPVSSPAPSGKLFEYLACGSPILCVARRDNLAYRLVAEWRAGLCAAPDDELAIENAILELYTSWKRGDLSVSPEVRHNVLRLYSREALTGELASVLDDVTASDRQSTER